MIIGVSPDSSASHVKFQKKHSLNLTLLSDEDQAIMLQRLWREWAEKEHGTGRSSWASSAPTAFLIGRDGGILHVWNKVRGSRLTRRSVLDALVQKM